MLPCVVEGIDYNTFMKKQADNPKLSHLSSRCNGLERYTKTLFRWGEGNLRVSEPLIEKGLSQAQITEKHGYSSDHYRNPNHLFTIVLQGSMEVSLDERSYTANAGDLVYCSPGALFHRQAKEAVWFVVLCFRDVKHWSPLKQYGPYIRSYESADLVFILLKHIIDASGSDDEQVLTFGTEHARMLLTVLNRELLHVGDDAVRYAHKLRMLLQEIRLSPELPWTVKMMSDKMHVSSSTLKRMTREMYDTPPLALVIQVRMKEAQKLLEETKYPIEEIAGHLGYKSGYSFMRLFKKHVGIAPGAYRSQHRG